MMRVDDLTATSLVVLVGIAVWIASSISALTKSVDSLERNSRDQSRLKNAIKEAVLDALEEHHDPPPKFPTTYSPDGMKQFELEEQAWKERHER